MHVELVAVSPALPVAEALRRMDGGGASCVVAVEDGRPVGILTDTDVLRLQAQADIARLTFARADAWIDFWGNRQHDKPLTSLKSVMVIGVRGLGQVAANTLNILRGRREVVSK